MDLNHLHLHVVSVERGRAFYESYFGFRERIRHGDILFLDEGSRSIREDPTVIIRPLI